MTLDSITPERVDAALDQVFLDLTERILRHDSRTDPQGYAALVRALAVLVNAMAAMKETLLEAEMDG